MNKTITLETENTLKNGAVKNGRSSFLTQFLLVMVLLLTGIVIASLVFMNNLWSAYHEDDRLTYVTLDPVGNWTVERSDRQKDDFYQATLDSIITRLMGKCFSMNGATIQNDWAICAYFLNGDMKDEFLYNNYYFEADDKFNDFIADKQNCIKCKSVAFKTRDIDHKNSIPTSFQDIYGKKIHIYESLVYGTFIDSATNKETTAVIDLKWSFFNKSKRDSMGDLLVENPLAIYFIDYSIVEDFSK